VGDFSLGILRDFSLWILERFLRLSSDIPGHGGGLLSLDPLGFLLVDTYMIFNDFCRYPGKWWRTSPFGSSGISLCGYLRDF
jgi:hypothetical protein